MANKPVKILLVEDDPADAYLTQEYLSDSKLDACLNVVEDGVKAMAYLRKQYPYTNSSLPNLILLDLNMPKKNGHEVLEEIKVDSNLKHIPVLILTCSSAEEDINKSYHLGANSYIVKPKGLDKYEETVKAIEDFWVNVVSLPDHSKN